MKTRLNFCKMKKIQIIALVPLFSFLLSACKRDEKTCTGDKTAPKPIMAPQVQNLPGGASISYQLPDNSNLLYVRVEYQLKNVVADAKSSLYTNSVLVEGFGDILERKVKLYAVNRCEVASE